MASPTGNSPDESSPGNLRDLLRQRKLTRNRKSCLPCRERKVRCNRQTPCTTCTRRGHPDLCQYHDAFQGSPRQDWTHSHNEHQLLVHAQHADNRQVSNPQTATPTPIVRQDVVNRARRQTASLEAENKWPHVLGGGSMIAMARQDHAQPADRQNLFETGILHLLGMSDNSDQVPTEIQGENPYNSLPEDEEAIKLFELYRQRVHPFHHITYDLDQTEQKMCHLILARSRPNVNDTPRGLEAHKLLSLLHAIWATGAQFSDLSWDRRISLTQKHTTHAFGHLSRSDYFTKPYKVALQALLLLGNVLQNDMKPQAAWILGGTTNRLALSLGIHKPQPQNGTIRAPMQDAGYLRLATVWQDALISVAFDRCPTSHEMDSEGDLPKLSSPTRTSHLSYRQSMSWICHLTLRHLSRRATTSLLAGIACLFQDIESLENSLAPHLRDIHHCSSAQEVQEHYSFELHKNFALSTMSRPIASTRLRQTLEEAEAAAIFEKFLNALKRSAWAFLRVCSISNHAVRSWAFVHNGLASALMLSFLKETRNKDETRMIQTGLIERLMGGGHDMMSDTVSRGIGRLSDVHKKALRALHTLKRLAEADSGPRSQVGGDAGAPQASIPHEQVVSTEEIPSQHPHNSSANPETHPVEAQDYSKNGDWDLDEWLRAFNGDYNSPLEAFDFIMTDQQPDFIL